MDKDIELFGMADTRLVGAGETKVEIDGQVDLEVPAASSERAAKRTTHRSQQRKKRPSKRPPAKSRQPSALEKKGARLGRMVSKRESYEERRALELEIAKDADVAISRRVGEEAKGSTERVASAIRRDLVGIQASRASGYQQAVTRLGLSGLKEAADVEALAIGLADSGLWALTIFSPWMGATKLAIEMMKAARLGLRVRQSLGFTDDLARSATAPLSQIRVDSAAKVGGALAALQDGVASVNDRMCDLARDRAHVVLAQVVSQLEREDGETTAEYLAGVEVAARVATFGPALDKSGSVDSEAVRVGAFNALMKEFLVQSSVVKDGTLSASMASKRHGPTVDEAARAVGSPANLGLRPHELEAGQILRAANELGCTPHLSPTELRERLAQDDDFLVPTAFNPNYAFAPGGGSRWISLVRKDIAYARPNFKNSQYMTSSDLEIRYIRVSKKQREKVRLGEQRISQIRNVDFLARGRSQQRSTVVGAEVPDEFSIRFRVR